MLYMQSNEFKMRNTCVAFGRFDGLHVGHREVLARLIEEERRGLTSVLLQLHHQPHDLFGRHKRLSTRDEMSSLLQEKGPQVMLSHTLSAADISLEPEAFIAGILRDKLGAKVVVAGADCRFGKDGGGNAELLRECASAYGYEAVIVDTVCEEGNAVCSQAIRQCLLAGEVEKANRLLGAPYLLRGEVVHGKALGRGSNMPTANLQAGPSKLIPAHGVYATLTKVDDEVFFGLTNIGHRPTVDNLKHVTIETFLLDFSQNIYGKVIETQLHLYIRGVQKFDSLDDVRAQIDSDLEQVRSYFEQCRVSV